MSQKKKKQEKKKQKAKRQEVSIQELHDILDRAKGSLSDSDHERLVGAVDTLASITQLLESKDASLRRLRSMLFGPSTEKLRQLFPDAPGKTGDSATTPDPTEGATAAPSSEGAAAAPSSDATQGQTPEKTKRKGHGRNGASQYTGATNVHVDHASLKPGCVCPDCNSEGCKVYEQKDPALIVRITGMAPITASIYKLQRLRCHICGKVFTAASPEGVGDEKYDETVPSMVGMLRYGAGIPFYRLEHLQSNMGIPLPAGTQWDLVDEAADQLEPAFEELERQAAQGEILHNDDTTMTILDLDKERLKEAAKEDGTADRTGTFTTGIVSTGDDHPIALFFTGRQHAGENLKDVLAKRSAELEAPIQMSDGLSRNTPGSFQTIMANCMAHARRKYVEVVEAFPDECRHILETLGEVYRFDDEARSRKMSPEERLRWHQVNSAPLMDGLRRWFEEQFEAKLIEPNSELGKAIRYMTKRWDKLTLFLRVAGAPIDNNICERALKRAILHRKNSLFYKTQNGARVGDIYMSLIHTAELNGVNPFEYLVALLKNDEDLRLTPSRWMPWNFRQRMKEISVSKAPT